MRFSSSPASIGFYVPNTAITLFGDNPAVYRVEDGIARATPVALLDAVDERRRIEGVGISAGVRIVVGGVHYISEGQPVSVSEVVELTGADFSSLQGDKNPDLASGPPVRFGLVVGVSCPETSTCGAIERSVTLDSLEVVVN